MLSVARYSAGAASPELIPAHGSALGADPCTPPPPRPRCSCSPHPATRAPDLAPRGPAAPGG